jgi:divalent metal cation (Fe/Co/Zn/Cd) transporter
MVRADGGESAATVVVAFAANLAIAIAKTVAAVLSGSASMTAEAAHSWADTGNETFLLIANRRGRKGVDELHPLGYGRETYVWSLLAAVGLFVVGATLSIWHGVTELMSGAEGSHENYLIAYIVLAISLYWRELRSFRRSLNCAPRPKCSIENCSSTHCRPRIRRRVRCSPRTPPHWSAS